MKGSEGMHLRYNEVSNRNRWRLVRHSRVISSLGDAAKAECEVEQSPLAQVSVLMVRSLSGSVLQLMSESSLIALSFSWA
jgi:hypothetical protein